MNNYHGLSAPPAVTTKRKLIVAIYCNEFKISLELPFNFYTCRVNLVTWSRNVKVPVAEQA